MAIEIRKVDSSKDLKRFINFNNELYKDCAYSVPELFIDVQSTLSRDKNPAFEFCEADYFLAYKDGKLVGRVAAIINHRANEAWNQKVVRFGWIDFIDDREVSQKLIDTVRQWGKEKGMTEIEGPLGFTDLDPEGMLIEGFDQLSTMATIYNYPYYPEHMEAMGFEKATDWMERKIYIPESVPEKHKRISDIVLKKYGLRIRKFKSKAEVKKSGIVHDIFRLINESYTPLFGFSRLSERQIDYYVKAYVPVLDLRMVTIVENEEGEVIAVGVSMPSLAEALRKCKGKLFPFGWWHLFKALTWKKSKVLDLLLVAVRPDYQSKGVNAPLFTDLIPIYQEMGFEYAESNPQLEENDKVSSQWQYFHTEDHKRRRCFKAKV
jgi:GNAT superfamily N-acetyltransferase